jgi:DGQHR domain-containing protein
MSELSGVTELELIAEESPNLDTICYRGSAPLAHLALVSQPDVFDQETNPEGLQRDLSPKHASEAYEYAHRNAVPARPRAFPEVVLNVRDKSAVRVEQIDPGPDGNRHVRLRFNRAKENGKVVVSRVDGNHRLFYAAGDERRNPLLAKVPFQIHIGLTRDQERSLFVDINANQKGLNTSHLAIMQSKLTPEELEMRDHLDRWIAHKLVEDPASPWHGMIHLGGSKKGSRVQGLKRPINFASLQGGMVRTLRKSQYVHDLTDPQAQYALVRNYWNAVKRVFAEEWANQKDFLLLKNIGVWSMSIFGGTVIDRCMAKGDVSIETMARYLEQARGRWDWRRLGSAAERSDNSVDGMSGHRAALVVAAEMAKELSDETGENPLRELQDQLLSGVARGTNQ